jgi:predicted RNA-binding protein with RPS1 domain/tetratricopeptide (TPR) repeat protein
MSDSNSPDDFLIRDYYAFIAQIGRTLDVEGGLAAALDVADYRRARDRVAAMLDVEAGLQAALNTMSDEKPPITLHDPWRQFARTHAIGQVVPGKVTKLVPFGAFVRVDEGIEGLVHISELAERHVEIPEQVVQVGNDVMVKVIDIDVERRRISLSLKQANENFTTDAKLRTTNHLVGRDAELARLIGWTDDLGSGSGHAVLIEGEPGIGKSFLARAAIETAEERGFQTFWAEGDELGQALPLQPLLDALWASETSGSPRLRTIMRLLRGEVTSADPTTAASEQMLTLIGEMCSERPTVLIVDDLQWTDLATIAVWEWLARAIKRSPLLLIGVIRPVPVRDELAAIRRVVGEEGRIVLSGLRHEAVAELVTTISAGKPGKDLLRLAGEAGGNPLYLTELVGSLARSGRLTEGREGLVEVAGGPIPDSLLAAITNRLDFLPNEVRTVLQAAALLGVEFLVSDLAIVMGCRIAELVPAIDEARTAGVLRDGKERLAFRHPLIRDALYDDIAEAVRPAWHRDAARALVEAGAPINRVARQLLRGMNVPGAPLDDTLMEWLVDASPVLVAQAPRPAINLLEQAASRYPATTKRGAVLAYRLADALYRAGDSAAAEQVATHAMVVVNDPDVLVDLHTIVAQCRSMLGRADESLQSLSEALKRPGISARQRARLLVSTARAYRNLGEVSVAGRVASEALATAEEAGDRWALGWSLHVLIITSIMRGEVAQALPMFERALTVVGGDTSLTDLRLLLQINQAVALGDLDRYDEALRTAEKVREQADNTGSLVRLAQAQSAFAELLFEVGRWDDAQAEIETLSDEFKDPGVTCCDRGIAAVIAFHRGDPATARQHLSRAASSADKIGNRVVASLTLARSLDREMDDDPGEALAVLVAEVSGHTEELEEMEDLLPEAARLAATTGTATAVADIAEQAAALARRSQVPHRLATAAYCRGLLDDDPALLQHAADRYDDAGRPFLRARALEAAAVKLADRGDRRGARTAFTSADNLYGELGAHWDLAHLRAQLDQYNIRRGPRSETRRGRVGWGGLTPAELEIVETFAEHMSNRHISEHLAFSPPRSVGTYAACRRAFVKLRMARDTKSENILD